MGIFFFNNMEFCCSASFYFIMLIFCVNSVLLPFGHTYTVLLQKLFIKEVRFHFRTHLENSYCCGCSAL